MPRAGLTAERIVAEASRIADANGLEGVTVAAVAGAFGVRAPSLYNHVGGREAIVVGVGGTALEELATTMSRATAGLAGEDALLAVAQAYRGYALAHPGRYAAANRAGECDPRYRAAGAAVLDVLRAVLRGYALGDADAVHAARTLRATVHGFVVLELAGGFALPVDLDDSFTWAVRTLGAGLAAGASPSPSS